MVVFFRSLRLRCFLLFFFYNRHARGHLLRTWFLKKIRSFPPFPLIFIIVFFSSSFFVFLCESLSCALVVGVAEAAEAAPTVPGQQRLLECDKKKEKKNSAKEVVFVVVFFLSVRYRKNKMPFNSQWNN